MPLQEISDGEITVSASLAPDPRADPERERERPETRGAVPPPRAPAVGIAKGGRSDSGARADVCREKCREDQAGRQAPAGDEEVVTSSHPAPDPQPEPDLED